jgi:hypothetical protein
LPDRANDFNFSATGIGSVPFQEIEDTCLAILRGFPGTPYWPQFVRRSYKEDMIIQYSEGLPLIEIQEDKRSLVISTTGNKEAELVRFYEHFLDQDVDYFSISSDYAPGLYALLELIDRGEAKEGVYVKGQTCGPVTFAAGIKDPSGKAALHSQELLEPLVNGLAIKALWQIRQLEKSGKRPIIFLDEPYLSGFGSAFSPIQRHEVIGLLQSVINYLREHSEALIGIHCCGNTDWSMLIDAGPDIVNFDAFGYMDSFLLYSDSIMKLLRTGGTIAWGIVPTLGFTGNETVEDLISRLKQGLERVQQWGIDPENLAKRSMLTPACGMGSMDPEMAARGMDLLSRLSNRVATHE